MTWARDPRKKSYAKMYTTNTTHPRTHTHTHTHRERDRERERGDMMWVFMPNWWVRVNVREATVAHPTTM